MTRFFDYHSTTPVRAEVIEFMLPFFSQTFGNAASKSHVYGFLAEKAVEAARETIAKTLKAQPKEIIFTSGATESLNLAIKGAFDAYASKGRHLITAATEHNAVLDCMRRLQKEGAEITILPVDQWGKIYPEQIEASIRPDTIMVAIMAANNEIGTLNPLQTLGKICRQKDVLFLTDATQAIGKIPIDVELMNIDLLACSAHKIYGPKGIGALYVRKRSPRVKLTPLIDGGGHEGGMRSGTLNVPAIAGFGKAIEIASKEMKQETFRLKKLRDRLEYNLTSKLDFAQVNGHPSDRLPNNLNISFLGVESEALMVALKDDVAVSSGSACTSEKVLPSHVLQAIGLPDYLIHSTIRFGLGRSNTEEEIDFVASRVVEEVKRLRGISPNFDQLKKSFPEHLATA